jgi:hypothetical protein
MGSFRDTPKPSPYSSRWDTSAPGRLELFPWSQEGKRRRFLQAVGRIAAIPFAGTDGELPDGAPGGEVHGAGVFFAPNLWAGQGGSGFMVIRGFSGSITGMQNPAFRGGGRRGVGAPGRWRQDPGISLDWYRVGPGSRQRLFHWLAGRTVRPFGQRINNLFGFLMIFNIPGGVAGKYGFSGIHGWL